MEVLNNFQRQSTLTPTATPALTKILKPSTRRNFITRAGLTIVGVSVYGALNKYIFSSAFQSKSSKNLQTFNFETVTVDLRGNITNRHRQEAQFFSEDLGSSAILEMIEIPGGSFAMSSPNTEAGRHNDEGLQHKVTVAPFFMGKYAVTQEQYQAVMGNNPSNFKGDKHPVENVTWHDAVQFCQKLSIKTGKIYRLPSEAEWEYACRAGTSTPFYFGAIITPDLVNYNSNNPYGAAPKGVYRQQTMNVGSFPPNAFGLYDMHGQVWEWCSDRWHDNYNGAPSDGSSWESGTSDYRVLRGGSWNYNAVDCRTANRDGYLAGNRNSNLGFRLALAFA